jgi:hypothetical protein
MKKSSPEPLHTIITRVMMTQQTIFIILVLMVFAVSSHWSAKFATRQARQSTLLISTNVSDYLSSSEHALVALAVSEPTQSGLDSVRASFNEFDVIYYILPNGTLDKISPKTSLITVGMDMTSQPYFNPGQTGLEISTPFTSSRTGKPTVYISQPGSRGVGLIVGELNLIQPPQQPVSATSSTEMVILSLIRILTKSPVMKASGRLGFIRPRWRIPMSHLFHGTTRTIQFIPSKPSLIRIGM